jgi:hypothetical protein
VTAAKDEPHLIGGTPKFCNISVGKLKISEGIIKVHLERHTFAKELKSIEGWE